MIRPPDDSDRCIFQIKADAEADDRPDWDVLDDAFLDAAAETEGTSESSPSDFSLGSDRSISDYGTSESFSHQD